MPKLVLAGALGVVGRGVLAHFEAKPDWEVVALSRRAPDFPTRAHFLALDLTDREACLQQRAEFSGATHLVYAALHEQLSLLKGWTEFDHIRVNLGMLANLLDGLEGQGASLRHVTLLQGGKAYGVHLGPPPMLPFRESDPRTMPPNFYYDQEDFIRGRDAQWGWTILRPPSVCGFALGSPMNTVLTVGTLAAITREFQLPLRFPGAAGHLKDTCDVDLIARAAEWAGSSDKARNQIFNITNGDCFLWERMFPAVARVFNMECAEPHPMSLARVMQDKASVWEQIADKHRLRYRNLKDLVPSYEYADFTFRYGQQPFASLMSTVKLRQAGFHDCIDSEEMIVAKLRALQQQQVLPT